MALPTEIASRGFNLVLDVAGQPVVAVLGDEGSAYYTCTGDCTTSAGKWQAHSSPLATDLDSAFPQQAPSGCTGARWQMWSGPSIALDPAGKLFMTFAAQPKGIGGGCTTGSAAITTTTFLFAPP